MFRRGDRRDKAEAPDDVRAAEDEGLLDDDELAEGEEEGELEDQPEDMTADLESQAADYLADNDVWMYGPNAVAVLDILDRLEELVPAEARRLAEAWLAIPKSDRDQARKAARKLAEEDLELGRHLQLAREAVGTWMAVTGPFPEFVNADPEWGRLCNQSGEAALDAATAVILEGKLEELNYESLLEPWSEVMADQDAAAEADALEGPADDEPDAADEVAVKKGDRRREPSGQLGLPLMPGVETQVSPGNAPAVLVELIRCRAGDSAEFELEACDGKGHLGLPPDSVYGQDQAEGRRRAAG